MTDRAGHAERIAALLARTADDHLRTAAGIATDDGGAFNEPTASKHARIQTGLLWSIAKRGAEQAG